MNRMKKIYQMGYSYLVNMLPEGLSEEDLQKYFIGDRRDFVSIEGIYEQFIHSAQNYRSMPNVIKYEQHRDKIKEILLDFDVQQIQKMDIDKLYYKFREAFNVVSKDSNQNSWRKWSRSAIDAAKFMSNFKDADDFRGFVARFDYNRPTRMALPLLLSTKISGIGFCIGL